MVEITKVKKVVEQGIKALIISYTGKKKNINWTVAEQIFLERNTGLSREYAKVKGTNTLDTINKGGFTFKDLAKAIGVHHGTIRNHAKTHKWSDKLRTAISEINEAGITKATETMSTKVADVRMRHATIARLCVSQCVAELETRKTLIIKSSAVDLFKTIFTGQQEERKALGIPDKLEINAGLEFEEDANFHTVAQHIESHQKKMRMLGVIVEIMSMLSPDQLPPKDAVLDL